MPDSPKARVERRPLWYQVHYSRAAQDANDAQRDNPALKREANARVIDVALVAATTLLAYKQRKPGLVERRMRWPLGRGARLRRRLTRFLVETVEPSTLTMLAGLNELKGATNLIDRSQLAQALVDGHLERYDLIEYVERNGNLSYRAEYNLACYYAATAEENAPDGQRALDWLARALHDAPHDEQAELARWATEDPSFGGLRRDELAAVVDFFAHPPMPHQDPPKRERRGRWRRKRSRAEE